MIMSLKSIKWDKVYYYKGIYWCIKDGITYIVFEDRLNEE